jgi:hypothetical protein
VADPPNEIAGDQRVPAIGLNGNRSAAGIQLASAGFSQVLAGSPRCLTAPTCRPSGLRRRASGLTHRISGFVRRPPGSPVGFPGAAGARRVQFFRRRIARSAFRVPPNRFRDGIVLFRVAARSDRIAIAPYSIARSPYSHGLERCRNESAMSSIEKLPAALGLGIGGILDLVPGGSGGEYGSALRFACSSNPPFFRSLLHLVVSDAAAAESATNLSDLPWIFFQV